MALLAAEALKNPTFSLIVSTKTAKVMGRNTLRQMNYTAFKSPEFMAYDQQLRTQLA